MDERLLTLEEVAEVLRASLSTIYREVRSGRLKASKVGRQWRVKRADLEAYLGAA